MPKQIPTNNKQESKKKLTILYEHVPITYHIDYNININGNATNWHNPSNDINLK